MQALLELLEPLGLLLREPLAALELRVPLLRVLLVLLVLLVLRVLRVTGMVTGMVTAA